MPPSQTDSTDFPSSHPSRPLHKHPIAARVAPTAETIQHGLLHIMAQHMERLDDTEIRFLLLFCEPQRSSGFSLSHAQIQNLTGRSSDSLTRAVAKLVERGWLHTLDASGRLLATPPERRAAQGRVVYHLTPRLTDRFATDRLTSNRFTSPPRSERLSETVVRGVFPSATPATTSSANSRSTSANSGTYKRRQSVKAGASLLGREAPAFTSLETLSSEALETLAQSPETSKPLDAEMDARCSTFLVHFTQAWEERFSGETGPEVTATDRQLLARRLLAHPETFYAKALPLFFASDHPETIRAYVEPRRFSLEAFLTCVFVLVYGQKHVRRWHLHQKSDTAHSFTQKLK